MPDFVFIELHHAEYDTYPRPAVFVRADAIVTITEDDRSHGVVSWAVGNEVITMETRERRDEILRRLDAEVVDV